MGNYRAKYLVVRPRTRWADFYQRDALYRCSVYEGGGHEVGIWRNGAPFGGKLGPSRGCVIVDVWMEKLTLEYKGCKKCRRKMGGFNCLTK